MRVLQIFWYMTGIYLALVTGDHDRSSEGDAFCRIVNILLNPTIQNCQSLKEVCPLVSVNLSVLNSNSTYETLEQACYKPGLLLNSRVILKPSALATALSSLHKLSMTVVIQLTLR